MRVLKNNSALRLHAFIAKVCEIFYHGFQLLTCDNPTGLLLDTVGERRFEMYLDCKNNDASGSRGVFSLPS